MFENLKGRLSIVRRFATDARANVAMIFALSAVPIIFLTGMGVDYTLAVGRQSQLNAVADSAALVAITPAMMSQSGSAVSNAVLKSFNAQASALSNINLDPSKVTVSIGTTAGKRIVTLNYVASSQNTFPNVLGAPTIPISGGAQATGGLAPNIDFYLLMDSSPSMALPATQAGIDTMIAKTPDSCAFACHESCPSCDGLTIDNYQVARNNNVPLRIDLVNQAAQNLTTTAQSVETTNHASYRMASYSFDLGLTALGPLTSSLSTAKSDASKLTMYEVCKNNYDASCKYNNDTDSNFDVALTGINKAMPNPGSGTGVAGDTPQEVLFLVTDGVEDETNGVYSREQSVIDTANCDKIKQRGIRIAVLYTYYIPIPADPWYNGTYGGQTYPVATFQSKIGSTLQSCSSPGLFYQVQVGGDISAALASLFQLAVQSAYLSQ